LSRNGSYDLVVILIIVCANLLEILFLCGFCAFGLGRDGIDFVIIGRVLVFLWVGLVVLIVSFGGSFSLGSCCLIGGSWLGFALLLYGLCFYLVVSLRLADG